MTQPMSLRDLQPYLEKKKLIADQVRALYLGGYITAGEAADLIIKYTEIIRVEFERSDRAGSVPLRAV